MDKIQNLPNCNDVGQQSVWPRQELLETADEYRAAAECFTVSRWPCPWRSHRDAKVGVTSESGDALRLSAISVLANHVMQRRIFQIFRDRRCVAMGAAIDRRLVSMPFPQLLENLLNAS